MEWFYAKGGQQIGPVDKGTIQQLLASGQLSAGDMVWKDGMAGWQPAGSVPELAIARPMGGFPPPAQPQYSPTQGYAPQQQYAQQAGFVPQQSGFAPQQPGLGYVGAPTGQSYKGLATSSLVCSCIGVLCFGIILGVVGAILGIVALNGMKRTGNQEGHGMAVAGVIVGIIAAVLAVIIIVVMVQNHSGPFANF